MQKNNGTFGIQGDNVMRNLIQLISEEYAPTSIVETGTYKGHTTSLFAKIFPSIPIYSCEIVVENYLEAKINTKNKQNIKIFNQSSPEFLKEIIHKGLVGKNPLFFLDAHWLNYWPLADELKIISTQLRTAIIIIDDFKVPGDLRFEYDHYDQTSCSVDALKPALNKKNSYLLLLPKYTLKDAYQKDTPHHPLLVGHAILFQNQPKIFSEKNSREFINKYFEEKTPLLTQ